MNRKLAVLKAVASGNISIDYIPKTPIKRTPGDVTEVSHN